MLSLFRRQPEYPQGTVTNKCIIIIEERIETSKGRQFIAQSVSVEQETVGAERNMMSPQAQNAIEKAKSLFRLHLK